MEPSEISVEVMAAARKQIASRGGIARAAKLSPARRREIAQDAAAHRKPRSTDQRQEQARKAAAARWRKPQL